MKTKPLKAMVRLVLSLAVLAIVFQIVGGREVMDSMRTVRLAPWAAVLLGSLRPFSAAA